MEVNDSKPVNFTFLAHPKEGDVSLEVKDSSGNGTPAHSISASMCMLHCLLAVPSKTIHSGKNYTEGTSHVYELRVNLVSELARAGATQLGSWAGFKLTLAGRTSQMIR